MEEALLARSKEREKGEGESIYVLPSCVPLNRTHLFSFCEMISRGPQRNRISFQGGCKSGPVTG
jgi:hypothetical protein